MVGADSLKVIVRVCERGNRCFCEGMEWAIIDLTHGTKEGCVDGVVVGGSSGTGKSFAIIAHASTGRTNLTNTDIKNTATTAAAQRHHRVG